MLRGEKRIASIMVTIVVLVLAVVFVVRMSGDADSSREGDALAHSGDSEGALSHDARDARADGNDSEPSTALKLEGVVLDHATDAPIAGASVRAHANESKLGDARTDAEGRFVITIANVKATTTSLTAAAPEYESKTQSIDFATDRTFITIRLKPLAEKPRIGLVLDSDRKPVRGAAVKIVTAMAPGGDRLDEVERKKKATLLDTITGPDGEFILPEGSEGAFASAFEASHGVGQKRIPPEGPLEIILSGGESVELRVVDASTRAAISSFEVALWGIQPAYNVPVVEYRIAGRDGLCTFTDDPALYALRIVANGYGSAEMSRSRGERWPREVALTPGRRLTLRFDAPAAITGHREVPFLVSADDKVTIVRGTAELGVPHVIEGFPQVKALHVLPSHPELIDPLGPEILGNSIRATLGRRYDVPLTGDIEVRVTLEEGRRFSGRFLDDAGQPVPDLTLTVFPRDARLFHGSRHRWRTVKTDGDGRFSVGGLLDDWYWIHLLDDAWVPRVSGVTGSIDNDARIEAWFFATRLELSVERDFIVQRAATVNASAADASGRPLAGAHVRLEVKESDPRKMVWGSFGGRFGDADLSHGYGAPCAVTKADGTCSIRGLPPFSETRFIVEHEDHAPAEFVLDLSQTRTDEPMKLEARLVDQAHARAIVTSAGEPVPDVRLRGGWPQFDSHVGLPWVTTNEDGIADLVRLPLGRVGIYIDFSTAPSGQMLVDTGVLTFDATSTPRDIAIAFRAVVYVKGTIQREDGTPFRGSVAVDVDGRRRFGRAGNDGQVSIEVGRPGRFEILDITLSDERRQRVRFVAKDPSEAYLDTSSTRTIVVIPAPK